MTLAQSLIDYFISPILGVLIFVIVIQIIMSWLIHFNVINIRNQLVSTIYHMLTNIVRPILAPAQRLIPSFGGMDFSPIIVILVLQWIQGFVLPRLYAVLG